VVVGLCVVLLISIVLALGLGPATIAPTDTLRYLIAAITGGTIESGEVSAYQIIWQIRTPRVLLAALVGAGLGAVGVAIQTLVRNPLADPYVLGVSSGASAGAVAVGTLGLLGGLGLYALSVGAFAGAGIASVLVFLAARTRLGLQPLRLVLTGVTLSFGFQAVMSVIIYLAPNSESTAAVLYWTMGSFGAANWGSLPIITLMLIIGLIILRRHARTLDLMALGDETAASLGVRSSRVRRRLFVLTALLTGAMVAVSGAIGFVGLVLPHLVRLVVGASHARVIMITPPAAAIFLVWVDLASRTVVAPRELPLGVLTALIGVPIFIGLIRRRGYHFGAR
jgi:iron complex transport system permease protein